MRKRNLLWMILIFVMMLSGCFWDSEECIVITADGFAPRSGIVVYPDSNCNMISVEFSGELSLEITVNRNEPLPILVYQKENNFISSRPYGCIYPYSTCASQKCGFASSVFYNLYMSSSAPSEQVREYCSRFNWKRFMELIDRYEDPWLLDQENIVSKIASGKFRSTDIKYRQDNKL